MKKLIIVPLLFILSLNVSAQSKALTNETIWKDYAFYNESVSGVRSMNDGENYTSLVSDPKSGMTTIKKFPYNSESQPESIIDLSALIFVGSEGKKRIKINDYQFNADETKILLATEQESIYRHSTKAYYYVYDIETKKMAELSESS
ncbi:MAG: DPP IV N-terminal domain-containing protein, partial [Flavobacteriales bacterium]|nr:DPP IV N-terminal domain-containing protein [Flavobacteriales bacterium]